MRKRKRGIKLGQGQINGLNEITEYLPGLRIAEDTRTDVSVLGDDNPGCQLRRRTGHEVDTSLPAIMTFACTRFVAVGLVHIDVT